MQLNPGVLRTFLIGNKTMNGTANKSSIKPSRLDPLLRRAFRASGWSIVFGFVFVFVREKVAGPILINTFSAAVATATLLGAPLWLLLTLLFWLPYPRVIGFSRADRWLLATVAMSFWMWVGSMIPRPGWRGW